MRRLIGVAILGALVALAPTAPARAQDVNEIALYQAVKGSNDPDELQLYLKAYPKGIFVPFIQKRLDAIKAASEAEKAAEAKRSAAGEAVKASLAEAEQTAAPTADEIKAMLALYYADPAKSFGLVSGGKVAAVTYLDLQLGPKEIMLLYNANYPEYNRRKSPEIMVASWKVHIVLDAHIVDPASGNRVAREDRDLRMARNEHGQWVFRWGD